jgi:hypothetical protein
MSIVDLLVKIQQSARLAVVTVFLILNRAYNCVNIRSFDNTTAPRPLIPKLSCRVFKINFVKDCSGKFLKSTWRNEMMPLGCITQINKSVSSSGSLPKT